MRPAYEAVGGLTCADNLWFPVNWSGNGNWSWPFACLTLRESDLWIQVPFASVLRFERDQILRVSRVRRLLYLYSGVQLEHSVPKRSKVVVFSTFGCARLLREFKLRGYPVAE